MLDLSERRLPDNRTCFYFWLHDCYLKQLCWKHLTQTDTNCIVIKYSIFRQIIRLLMVYNLSFFCRVLTHKQAEIFTDELTRFSRVFSCSSSYYWIYYLELTLLTDWILKSFFGIRFWTKLGDIFLKDIKPIRDIIMALLINGRLLSGNLSSKGLVGQEAAPLAALWDSFLDAHPLTEWGKNISSSHTLFS